MSGSKTHSKKTMAIAISVGAALLAGALLLWFAHGFVVQKPSFEQTQAEYVQPEVPVDRSKSIALPGWSNFTIPAYTKDVTQGFEFHNPAENRWYESALGVKGAQPEKLVSIAAMLFRWGIIWRLPARRAASIPLLTMTLATSTFSPTVKEPTR